MTNSTLARAAFWTLLVLGIFALVRVESELAERLYQTSISTGWFLLLLIIGLAAFNLRKKLPALPLGSAALWLEIHIGAAVLSFFVYALHAGFRIPAGTFEALLALSYWTVFGSGLIGFVLIRVIPQRLTSRGCEVLFERIPEIITQIRTEADQTAVESIARLKTTRVADFYLAQLRPFFVRPRNLVWHVMESDRATGSLLLELRHQRSLMNEDEQAVLGKIEDQLRKKNDLDYQYAMQGLLKLWGFAHVPMTYGLLVFSLFHLISVYAFAGGR